MRSPLRAFSRLLLLVMLATVLSPNFGWQAAEAMAVLNGGGAADAHHHAADHAAHDHGGHAGDHQHALAMDQGCGGGECPGQGHEDCAETLHHCCPGHILGQLLAGTAVMNAAFAPAGHSVMMSGDDSRFSSRIPEGLERPPRSSAA